MSLPTPTARSWIQRWDRQQEQYLPDREQRLAVVADIVMITAERLVRPDPIVLDIGCGPGSLSARIRQRLPQARLVGLDGDPLLLGLASANYPWLTQIRQDLRDPQWTAALPYDTVDAVVSTTALHWLVRDDLERIYQDIAGLLRPGGVFVNGDYMPAELDVLNEALRTLRARRAGVTDREDWGTWCRAVEAAPELAELVAERGERPPEHSEEGNVGFDAQAKLLRGAGFAEVGPVWQVGADRVLVGLR